MYVCVLGIQIHAQSIVVEKNRIFSAPFPGVQLQKMASVYNVFVLCSR